MLSVDNNEVKLAKPLNKRFQYFSSPLSDFSQAESPNVKDLFKQVYSAYNLRAIHANKEREVCDSKPLANGLVYLSTIDTAQMIADSRGLYIIPPHISDLDICDGDYAFRLTRPHRMSPILKKTFPIDSDPRFNDLRVNSEWKFTERKTGLKEALSYHLAIMKNHEPAMYDFCLDAARKLNAQSPIQEAPEAILPISVHQDEPFHCELLIDSLIKQKGVNNKNIHVYFFVNGDDPKKISDYALKLNSVIESKKEKDSTLFPKISVVAASINEWRFGLKAIPLNIAMMQLMLSGTLTKSDADIPAIFLDADLLYLAPNLVRTRIDSIKSGKLLAGGPYAFMNLPKQNSEHINCELLKILVKVFSHLDLNTNDLDKLKASNLPIAQEIYRQVGGNASSSLMALAYSGGIRPYSFYEEFEWQRSLISLFTNVFEIKDLDQGFTKGLIDRSNKEFVVSDGGEFSRILKQGLSLKDLYYSHKGEQSQYTKIDFGNKKLNLKRLQEDVDYCVNQKIQAIISSVSIPQRNRKRFMDTLLQKISTTIDTYKKHESISDYKNELDLIKTMIFNSFKRYGIGKIRFRPLAKPI